jgi:truncated hemoglobin YjbI
MEMASRDRDAPREMAAADPLFDKYPLTGRTYRTAAGTVVANELQYHDGEMVHLHGECTHVSAVEAALAGSGYRAVTIRYPDGRRTAVAQLWVSRFSRTTIGPYSAMFIVVLVVPDHTPDDQASFKGDPNGASSVLAMLDGSFDAASGVYENRARLYLVRLIDTTQVAIDVGRERMGTDKRAGSVDLGCRGRRLHVSVTDRHGRGIVRGDFELAGDPLAFQREIAHAATVAGVTLQTLPSGTEYAYPAVARIGRGPIVQWYWRCDGVPSLQPVAAAGSLVIGPGSEEGRMLLSWGYTPKVLGYVPHVRGVVTGLSDAGGAAAGLPASSDGTPRSAVPAPRGNTGPGGPLPVLRLVAQRHAEHSPARPIPGAHDVAIADSAGARQPRWAWEPAFLGSLTAMLRKETVGVTPDGLRINWHVTSGTFAGPDFDAVVLPGAADWMRIRRDGVAIVNVQACFETRDGVRVFGSYGGIFDLGHDGYARALREEYDELPPVVVTPTYATADAGLAWLNRAQCVGVGRVDMTALRVEFDVYVVRVGARMRQGVPTPVSPLADSGGTLYERLGGQPVIVGITDDFVTRVLADRQLGRFFSNTYIQPGLRDRVVELLCQVSGGPCTYHGRDMKTAHQGMGITESDWAIAVDLFGRALDAQRVGPRERAEFLQIIEQMRGAIVEPRRGIPGP